MLNFKRISGLLACACMLTGSSVMAQQKIKVTDRDITIHDNGEISIKWDDKPSYKFSFAAFVPTWRQISAEKAFDLKQTKGTNQLEITGKLPHGSNKDNAASFAEKVSWTDKTLTMEYKVDLPKSYTLMPKSHPFVVLEMPKDLAYNNPIKLGGVSVKLYSHNQHGWGDQLLIPSEKLVVKMSAKTGLSIWKAGKTGVVAVRSNMVSQPDPNNKTTVSYKLTVSIEFKASKVEKPRNFRAMKPTHYRRLLLCPLETGLKINEPLKWLKDSESKDNNGKDVEFAKTEDWLELRARLYELRDRNNHLNIFNKVYPTSADMSAELQNCLGLLNNGSIKALQDKLSSVEAKMAAITKQVVAKYGFSYLPISKPNPFGWVKAYSTLGFRKHPEGVLSLEPSPLNTTWYDNFSIMLDSNDKTKLLTAKNQAYRDVVFDREVAESMRFKRSWVTTEWLRNNKTYTFSVLTPMLDVDNTDSVEISLSTAPSKLKFMTTDALPCNKELFGNPTIKFDETPCVRNWMIVSGKGYHLALIMGSKPVSFKVDGSKVTLKLKKRSFVSLIRMPAIVSPAEYPREAEFWGRVALALPVQAVEKNLDGKVTYTYLYKERRDEWGTEPLKIAPVPPLAINGNIAIPGAIRTASHIKYGVYSYVPGNTLSFELPDDFNKLNVLRGVNVGTSKNDKGLKEYKENGCDWIRSFMGHGWKKGADAYKAVEEQIKSCKDIGIKIIIDPHDFVMKSKWGTGMPDRKVQEKFLEMWDKLSKIGAKYPGTVAGYDIYNEHQLRNGSYAIWRELATEVADVIRKNDRVTPILVTGTDMANTSGYFNAQPLDRDNVGYTFHFYSPHSFTHQKIQSRYSKDSTLFYPGWITPMDWGKGTHFGEGPLAWYDRWNLGAGMLPIFEFYTRFCKPLHCGEFSVVGYTNYKAGNSALNWTRDAADWLERYRISWHLWNMGFGLCNPMVKDDIYKRWKDK